MRPLLKQNLAEVTRALGEDDDLTQRARVLLVAAYLTADNLGRAIPLVEQAAIKHQHIHAVSPPASLLEKVRLAQARYAAGDYRRARTSVVEILGEFIDTDSSPARNSSGIRATAAEMDPSQGPLFAAYQRLAVSKPNSDIQADHAPTTGTNPSP
jgi:hypothetical protein